MEDFYEKSMIHIGYTFVYEEVKHYIGLSVSVQI